MRAIKRLNHVLLALLITGALVLVSLPVTWFFYDGPVHRVAINNWHNDSYWTQLIKLITGVCVLIMTYKIRIATVDFYAHRSFNNLISKQFHHIGILILGASIFYIVSNWLLTLLFAGEFYITLNIIYLIPIGTALFFFTLSTMIKQARGMQEENDLTI